MSSSVPIALPKADPRRADVSASSCSGLVMLRPTVSVRLSRSKRITPPSSPRSTAAMTGEAGSNAVPRKPTMSIRPIARLNAADDVVALPLGSGDAVGDNVNEGAGSGVRVGAGGEDEAGEQAATSHAPSAPAPARNRRREVVIVRRSVPGSPAASRRTSARRRPSRNGRWRACRSGTGSRRRSGRRTARR